MIRKNLLRDTTRIDGPAMPTQIGLISDTHSTTAPLKEALAIFEREKVNSIIYAVDIAGHGEDQLEKTIDLLQENNCLMISGNHDYYDTTTKPESSSKK